ncbi:MAG: polysaccharide biosynthesis tyrosine autokinase [Ferruginibacter sp.]
MPQKQPVNSDLQQNLLIKSIYRFAPYWQMYLLLLLTAFLCCFIYLLRTAPLYEASATILVQDKKRGSENAKAIEDLDMLQSKKIIDNETDVVTSMPLISQAINKLHLYAPVYKKNTFRDKLLYNDAPVIIECGQPEQLAGLGKIPFTFDALANTLSMEGHVYSFGQWQNTSFGKLRFTINPGYRAPAGNNSFLFSLENIRSLAHDINDRLKAVPTTKLSSLIKVTYKDENPQRAEDFVNSLIDAYTNAGKTDKNILATNTLAFIDQRIAVVEKELHDIEQRKQQFSSRNGAFDISTQGRLFLENVSSNDQKMSDINMGLSILNEVDSYISSNNNATGSVPSVVGVGDPQLSQMVEKLYNAQVEYEALKKSAGENNPIVLPLKNKIEKIKPDIAELIKNQRANLQVSRKNVYATNNSYASLLNTLPKTERQLVDMDREQNIKSGVYSFLLQKKEETALSQQSIVPETKLISSDLSEDPVSPKIPLILFGACVMAILAGTCIVIVKESLSNKVMFRDQIELATGFPVIGEISFGVSRDPIVISDDTKTFIAEQFRRLRMTLNYNDVHDHPKKILVTSAISGEGKSFIASNLALTLALTGRKVALLDFDLNNPSLNNKLNISQRDGITDFLLDECSLESIIHPTDLDPNLFLVSTGRLPHNPTELLMNGRTELLLKQLEKDFDFIVVDTAPVIPVTDAYILSKFCDATLYVIRHKYTPKIFLERMDEDNKMHRLINVGIVFNSIAPRGTGNHNYGYGYGYGYTYENSRKGKRLGTSLS